MAVLTTHKYIDLYPILPSSRRLIIGTIHPHRTDEFAIDFFYGNVGSFWSILSSAFPKRKFKTKDQIISTLVANRTGITDMIRSCSRSHDTVTADSQLFNIELNLDQIDSGIRQSEIDTIYFTSRMGCNNAAKLFLDAFDIQINQAKANQSNEFIIPKEKFGREIRGILLYSPSGMANRGIANSIAYKEKKLHYSKFDNPIKQFKLEFFREKFEFLQ